MLGRDSWKWFDRSNRRNQGLSRIALLAVLTTACGGTSGTQGPAGPAGADGPAPTVTAVGAGNSQCPTGGAAVTSGSTTVYICNGASGMAGVAGVDATAPVGTIMAFAGATPPAGWLLCDGAPLSRTTYATLFATIQIAWGGGDGVNTFNLPDLRGRFLRGVDKGAGRDPDAAGRTASAAGGNTGDAVGSVQASQFGTHAHALNHGNGAVDQMVNSWVIGNNGAYDPSGDSGAYMGGSTASAGGKETRPINANVHWIIKY